MPSPQLFRLWPGVVFAALLALTRFIIPAVAPKADLFGLGTALVAVAGGLLFSVAILLWWMFFSRAPWSDRFVALAAIVVAIFAIGPFTHISLQNGLMDRMLYVYAFPPTLSLALVLWAATSGSLASGPRRVALVAAILLGSGVWTLARTDGLFWGLPQMAWRWTPTAEDRLLAQARTDAPIPSPPAQLQTPAPAPSTAPTTPAPVAPPTSTPAVTPTVAATSEPAGTPTGRATSEPGIARVEWAGFRGSARDGVVRGLRINTDWSTSPPVELWRRPVGPGWSSFAVSGDLFYTQEQRGEEEMVSCYRLSTGEPVWRHSDPVRFWESNGGAGPRGTPTLHNGRVYALGATGILNALDARTGAVVWSRNAATDNGRDLPGWGFTSSPIVVDDVVIVATSGTMSGYDSATGAPRWTGPRQLGSYSSPHRVTIDGVPQVILLSGSGAVAVAPATGAVLWQHDWPDGGTTIVQPAAITGSDVLINTASAMGGIGMRRLHITRAAANATSGWTVEERWTSNGLKPYFNDYVVHKGQAFGFDGNILSSINLEDGKRNWKGGRYGNGQMVLLADQDVLLVLSEEGDLALVSATTDKFIELARFPALNSKAWNHPVIVGGILLVRNGEEMAAFRLPR